MSVQQINLLNPHLLTPRVAFSSRTIAGMLLAVVGLGFAIYAWTMVSAQDVRSKMDQVQTTRDELQARLDALDQPGDDGLTEADKRTQAIAAAQEHVAQLHTLQAALGAVHGAGYAAKLRALANEGTPGVWLTDIEFGQSGFRLEGRALQPGRISDYLAVLSRQPALATLALSGFSVAPVDAAEESGKPPVPGVAFVINPITRSVQP